MEKYDREVYDLAAHFKKTKVVGDKSGDPKSFLEALKEEIDKIREEITLTGGEAVNAAV